MARSDVTRRLAAVMVADVVGYSHLIEADEAGTLAQLKSHRKELAEPKIAEHGGHVVKTMGDGLLIEFPSAVEALSCAVEFQDAVARRNRDVPEALRVEYRIGINLGDVVVEGDDILGHGVNIASRLESLAEPGGICVSRPVYDQVKGRLEAEFDYLGEQQVHNIEEPVRAYAVRAGAGAPPAKPAADTAKATAAPSKTPWLIAGLAVIAAVAVAVGMGTDLLRPTPPEEPDTAGRAPAGPALPDKPSIAVLPFNNMSDDPSQEYFVDGMTEDLITDLSKVSGLFVVARNSTFSYKGKSVDVRQVGSDLGVRYVLEGSVRRAGEQVRINAQLIDATTGGHVWADRYDGSVADVFGLQDRVTNRIVAILAVHLTTAEEARIAHRETENTDAYDSFLKGWEQYQRQTPEGFREAIAHFEKAVELDPYYSRAYAALSATYWQVWKRFWHTKIGLKLNHEVRYRAESFLAKAMEDPTPLALQVAADMASQQGNHDEALAKVGRAIAQDPNDADNYLALAGVQNLAGNPEEALQHIELAMRLNPNYPPAYLYMLGFTQFGMENFADAALSFERATALNPDDRWSFRLLIATYGHLGRGEDAAAVMDLAETNWRGFDPLSVRGVTFWYPFKEIRDTERLSAGLRKAGVPD